MSSIGIATMGMFDQGTGGGGAAEVGEQGATDGDNTGGDGGGGTQWLDDNYYGGGGGGSGIVIVRYRYMVYRQEFNRETYLPFRGRSRDLPTGLIIQNS